MIYNTAYTNREGDKSRLTTGEFIRAQRIAVDMTQTDLAKSASVTQTTVSNWERDLCLPDPKQLISLAAAFGCTIDNILLPDAERAERCTGG